MGNKCVGSSKGRLPCMPSSIWCSRPNKGESPHSGKAVACGTSKSRNSSRTPQNKPPEVVTIDRNDNKAVQPTTHKQEPKPADPKNQEPVRQPEPVMNKEDSKTTPTTRPAEPAKPKKPHNVKRLASAGLKVESVLQTKTGHLKEYYTVGRKLGNGQFGTTFLCVEKDTGKEYACKS